MNGAWDSLRALCQLLLPDDEGLRSEVRQACESPEAYVDRFRERLAERGISHLIADLRWIALVDGLAARGRLAEVDWKEAAEDVVWNLERIAAAPDAGRWEWAEAEEIAELPTEEFLRRAGERLSQRGVALASLDINSDCYPLVLVDLALIERARDLATSAGHEIVSFAPHPPRARDRVRVALAAGAPAVPAVIADLAIDELPAVFRAHLDELSDVKCEQALAYAAVAGWDLNQTPGGIDTPPAIDHVVLTRGELTFCNLRDGRLGVRFTFLVEAIEEVCFDLAPAGATSVPPGVGLAQIYTPSGRTLLVCTQRLVTALQQAVAAQRLSHFRS